MLAQMQLIAAQILGRGGVRRTPEEPGELPHPADVAALGLLGELAQPHVLDHALTQRTDWPMLDTHGSAPVLEVEGVLHL
jgi:hypothetical protein